MGDAIGVGAGCFQRCLESSVQTLGLVWGGGSAIAPERARCEPISLDGDGGVGIVEGCAGDADAATRIATLLRCNLDLQQLTGREVGCCHERGRWPAVRIREHLKPRFLDRILCAPVLEPDPHPENVVCAEAGTLDHCLHVHEGLSRLLVCALRQLARGRVLARASAGE